MRTPEAKRQNMARARAHTCTSVSLRVARAASDGGRALEGIVPRNITRSLSNILLALNQLPLNIYNCKCLVGVSEGFTDTVAFQLVREQGIEGSHAAGICSS